MRSGIVIVGCAALALAACGSGSSPASKTSPAAARGGVQAVTGQITQVGGGRLVVKEPSGNVSVAYGTSTNVLLTGSATQSTIVGGACVVVTGRREPAGTVTADTVQVQFNMNGRCTPPPGAALGRNVPGNAVNLRGRITTVSGNSFVMQPVTAGGGLVTVNVPATAGITRLDTASTDRLAVGQCVRVNGQSDAAGVVEARALIITPAGPTGCTGPSGGQPRPSRSTTPGA